MTTGLVSIITPTYNCGRFIAETIQSVQAQTYTDWEMIIVDDCSTDNTFEIVKTFMVNDARIRYIRNERNSGAAITRNRALREAKGQWIAFLDSDDLWMPDKLKRQTGFMISNGYNFSYTAYSEIDSEGKDTNILITGPNTISKYKMWAFCWLGCLTVMYNKECIGLIQIADIKKNNDYAMWLRVCQKADCHFLNENLAKYRRGRTGSISTHSYTSLLKWHYKLFKEANGMNTFVSLFLTAQNLICGIYKKIIYVKRRK